ncbi:MAG: hypothetical protein JJT77_03365 [Crocinitomicaceae bacterium]|nr:hypothetical protein [Crocinitomicaceae bacterium]
MNKLSQVVLLFWCFASFSAHAQESNLHITKIPASSDTILLDSLTIYEPSMQVYCGGRLLAPSNYHFNGVTREFLFKGSCADSLFLLYRVFEIDFSKVYQKKDTSIVFKAQGKREDFIYRTDAREEDFFGGSSIQKSGSISRGIAFGNSQDLSLNSSLNLQLAGDISEDMKILATITDDNIPIQPDGNTNRLQEFDQVFIQLYGKQYKIIAGDFWLKKPQGHFMNYNKRAQGLFAQYEWEDDNKGKWMVQGAGALSKGKFGRNTIQGVEGNQGPYRLVGNENEPFIIILSGTEQVYLDGKLMERGQEFDYVIDYNTAEVTFTPRHQITRDIRIVIEFQYTDQNYARSLFQSSLTYESEKVDFWINLYSEQDAKNQTIQQDLSPQQRQFLSEIGDSLELARINSIDSIGFTGNQVTYKMIDSLGIDSILVYSVNPDSAHFRAFFTNVGMGNGDYVFDRFTAVGRVFKWVAPINGERQGDHTPSRLIVTPQRNAMVTAGMTYRVSEHFVVTTEVSGTNRDLNTFSSIDNEDNNAFGSNTKLVGTFDLGKDSIPKWQFITEAEVEYRTASFEPIERYRSVEFDRDWNVRGRGFVGQELLANLSGRFKHTEHGFIAVEGQNFSLGQDYQGNRARFAGDWNKNGYMARWDGSYLNSVAENQNSFLRHISEVSKSFKHFRIGFKDDHEFNQFTQGDTLLNTNSYQWYDWQFYIAENDSAENGFKIFYRERYDKRSDSSVLKTAATARSFGASYNWVTNPYSKLNAMGSYRILNVDEPNLITEQAENTLLGRLDYNLRLWKGAFTANTFYEVGSGLELKREFLYIQVNAGQGVYTWIDYNGDGIKDLNEFEIAQFPDQANYIRVFTPTNEYVRTFSNEFNQSIFWRPERIWANKKGAKKFLSRFSNQSRFRVSRRMANQDANAFNPIAREIADTSLLSYNSTIRNTLFFNRTNSVFGADYTFSNLSSKILLANGFDARTNQFNQINLRWNIQRKFTLTNTAEIGRRGSFADYTTGRDFNIFYTKIAPSIIYQPNTTFRVSIDLRLEDKENDPGLGGELAVIRDIGSQFKLNQAEKGSLQGGINMVQINYDGPQNNALAFEMLEALRPGTNFTWNLGYQRSVSKNLQITIQYNARKSEDNPAIHAGGVEVRAFF